MIFFEVFFCFFESDKAAKLSTDAVAVFFDFGLITLYIVLIAAYAFMRAFEKSYLSLTAISYLRFICPDMRKDILAFNVSRSDLTGCAIADSERTSPVLSLRLLEQCLRQCRTHTVASCDALCSVRLFVSLMASVKEEENSITAPSHKLKPRVRCFANVRQHNARRFGLYCATLSDEAFLPVRQNITTSAVTIMKNRLYSFLALQVCEHKLVQA